MTLSTARRCLIAPAPVPSRALCASRPVRIFISRPVMMLSSVLMLLKSAMFWNVRAIPEAAASWVRMPRCGRPL